ncbi:NO-inducible flavohemoprotein [Flavobacterium oreochromis]|uniref:Flavohemoprotein n=3 Tax=Flavobacterium TaxID=237 RepID=A0A246GAB5_9FLAO|nr:NO-inducible flavohemoprotein [Flavobacterium oreochromis]OWP75100.1 nitric oxide dioxygenase [Flavobacterium oreochromis]OWP76879.1 nitric oxide dioxygenase [Flavobacterium oreochromis]
MTTSEKELIKATIPVLRENGVLLTKHFYNRMFTYNPELKNIFNLGNQANGRQQTALAMAVLAYAEHIENPSVLIDVLKSIGNKHVSLNITKEQYEIVGNHLIASIKEVLEESATENLLSAWAKAYWELAEIMIQIEEEMYQNNLNKKGGWKGWRSFVITRIVEESEEIKSFYLTPKDNKAIADYLPGQYITIKTHIEELGHEQPRQYSLSSSFNEKYYRISVKLEKGSNSNPDGLVSNVLHNKKEGSEVLLSAPAGIFNIEEKVDYPMVLISGGIGITPLLSMLQSQKDYNNQTVWIHSCRNEKVQAFKNEVEEIVEIDKNLRSYTYYEQIDSETDTIRRGRINLKNHQEEILIANAKYYICGPELFIKSQYQSLINLGVDKNSIHFEEFGPQVLNLN